MNTKTQTPELLNKPLKIVATRGITEEYDMMALARMIKIAMAVLEKHPIDMLVFQIQQNELNVRLAGYNFENGQLDEETIAYCEKSHLWAGKNRVWMKIDDYGEYFLNTILKPSEY